MALQKVPVVALNKDAEVVGYYDSIGDAAKLLGCNRANLASKLYSRKTYKQMLFIREEEFRKLWMEGRADTLKFPSRKERNRLAALKRAASLSKESAERKREKCSRTTTERLHDPNSRHYQAIQRIKVPVECVETGECYPSIRELCREVGCSMSTMSYRINQGKTYQGKTYRRKTK